MLYFTYDDNQAYLSSQKIENFQEVGIVKWRGTNLSVTLLYSKGISLNKSKKTTNSLYPLLKSNLQKQIRRKDINAVATCDLMLELNDFECLRRLSVIASEDCEMTKETANIVWLMAATSKGFILSNIHRYFILFYVGNLVNSKICRRYELSTHQDLHNNCDIRIHEILSSNYINKEILAGIFFRTSYGGLDGDTAMILNLCKEILTANRPLENILPLFNPKIPITLKFSEACVDFHIYPSLCEEIYNDLVTNKVLNIDIQTIKSVIWHCSSGINARYESNIDPYYLEIWNKISPSFSFHTKTYLSKILKTYGL